jgi:hypothetical protein
MTQADSVHSTPPTNTSPTRRNILGTIAAAGAAALTLTPARAAAPGADPIFAAVDEFRRADADLCAAFEPLQEEGVIDKLWVCQEAAYERVIRTRPTTPAGLAALTTWARERMDWLRKQGSSLEGDKLYKLSAAIDDATRGMSGLEPWSPPLPAAIAVSADPAFALIAEKLAADIAHEKAIDAQGEFEGRGDFRSGAAIEAQENSAAACHYVNEVDWKLATTPPTTLAGVAAVLRFANEIEDAGLEWPGTDEIGPDGWHYQLRAAMAVAIESLIKAPAGKAVQS